MLFAFNSILSDVNISTALFFHLIFVWFSLLSYLQFVSKRSYDTSLAPGHVTKTLKFDPRKTYTKVHILNHAVS